MPDHQPPPADFLDFANLLRTQEERRAKRLIELGQLVEKVPVSQECIKEIAWLGSQDRLVVLRNHPGFEPERKLQSLWLMLAVFSEAHRCLLEQLERFHTFSQSEEMHLPVGAPQLEIIEVAVRKELVAFSAAAGALVDFSRRLRKSVPIPELDTQLANAFDPLEHKFITALRNVICHRDFPDVDWQITYGSARETNFVMAIEGLRHHGELPKDALAFLDRWSKGIPVRAMVDSYASRVNAFYSWYRSALEANLTVEMADYRVIVNACMSTATRSMYRVLLDQFLSKKSNPYEHLYKYLQPAKVEEALKLPMRSKEQVDFIIAAADKYGACDDELREKVYKLFDVSNGNEEHPPNAIPI